MLIQMPINCSEREPKLEDVLGVPMKPAPLWMLVKCFSLIYTAAALVGIALLNFSLAFILAAALVPPCLLIKPGGLYATPFPSLSSPSFLRRLWVLCV